MKMHENMFKSLAGIEITKDGVGGLPLTTADNSWLDLDDKTIELFHDELRKRVKNEKSKIATLKGRLDNKSYVTNAPATVVDETRALLIDASLSL